MSTSKLLPLQPPDEKTPEAWLSTMDATPRLVPQWPESDRLAIVMVELISESQTTGWVVLDREALEEQLLKRGSRLFFQVPRFALLRSSDICPGLTAGSWV
jgi:hypothetical protein